MEYYLYVIPLTPSYLEYCEEEDNNIIGKGNKYIAKGDNFNFKYLLPVLHLISKVCNSIKSPIVA